MAGSESWPVVPLSEVADEVTVGFVGPMTSEYRPSGIPFLRSQNVKPLRIEFRDIEHISREFHGRIAKSRLGPGDVVIVRTGAPGTCAVIPESLSIANCADLVVVRPGPNLNPHYLAYFVNFIAQHHVHAYSVGAVQQHFNVGSAKALPIPLPPRTIQDGIVAAVGPIDEKVELNRQMNRTLEAMAQAIFKSWFVDFDPVAAKAAGRQPFGMDADTAALFPARFGESALGPFPSGWRTGTLGDVADINARQVSELAPPDSIRYVDISSVSLGRLENIARHSWLEAPSRARRLVRNGDTIWSCVRPNRMSYYLIRHPEPDTVVSTGFVVLSPRDGIACFVYLWTTTDDFVDYLTSHAEGSAYPAVRPDSFARAPVIVPSPSVLRAFEAAVDPLLERCWQNEQESRTLAAFRDTLLPRLLSGEIRVREAERLVERAGA